MTDYFDKLVLAKDPSNLREFARRQDLIDKFLQEKRDAFNELGPRSTAVLVYEGRLVDLYTQEGNFDKALNSAKLVYQGLASVEKNDEEALVEALINLGSAYLNVHDLEKAQAIAAKANLSTSLNTLPLYYELIARIAQVHKDNTKEVKNYLDAYNSAKEAFGDDAIRTAEWKVALALCYQKQHYFQNALFTYNQVKSEENKLGLTNEESISLEARIAYCMAKMGQTEEGLTTLRKVKERAHNEIGSAHPTTLKIKEFISSFDAETKTKNSIH